MELNAEQNDAARHANGHALVLAGPGTGKTTTLVGRYQHLIENGVSAKTILCCTFSRKASDELKSRISHATSVAAQKLPIGTFHALAVRILRTLGPSIGIKRDFQIWTKDWERLDVIKNFQETLIENGSYDGVDKDDITPQLAMEFIDDCRETLLDPEDASVKASEAGHSANIAHSELYQAYEKYLNSEDLIDFPRMVQWACKALQQDTEKGGKFAGQFTHILIDEYQDINLAQKTLIDYLIPPQGLLWAVGDDFQAIYGWRGSDVRYLLNFEESYPSAKIYRLGGNYRSGKTIIHAANNLSKTLNEKIDKKLWSTRDEEGLAAWEHLSDEQSEALAVAEEIENRVSEGVPLNEIAVLARTNRLPRNVVRTLIQRRIPVHLTGGVTVFSDYETRLLITAIAVSSNEKPRPPFSLRLPPKLYGFAAKLSDETWDKRVKALTTYIAKRPPQGLSEEDVEARAERLHKSRDILLDFDDTTSVESVTALINPDTNTPSVFVGTIHSAKGLEWDTVFLVGMEDGILPQRQSGSVRAFEEEKRIAYVGITRAKNFLLLTSVGERGSRDSEISPFIEDMGLLDEPTELEVQSQTSDKRINIEKERQEFLDRYSSRFLGPDDRREWVQNLRAQRLAKEEAARAEREAENKKSLADGSSEGVGSWSDQAAGTGLLAEAGYTVRKNGPSRQSRQQILNDVLNGNVPIPDWLAPTVQEQWAEPNTIERLVKIRNTLNVALGNQKGRLNPSAQAIKKWEVDIKFLDEVLRPAMETKDAD